MKTMKRSIKTRLGRDSKESQKEWRNVIKPESKLGGKEDIREGKNLSSTVISDNEKVWKKKWKSKLKQDRVIMKH